MPFAFRMVLQLPGVFPDRDAAAAVARRLQARIPEATLLRVVSDLSDDLSLEEGNARARSSALRFRDLEPEEGL